MIRALVHASERAVLRWIGVSRVLSIQVDITNLCNLRCAHCYHPHHRNEGALSLSDWERILDEYEELIQKLGFQPLLIICGGEPLLSPQLGPLLQFLLSRGRSHYPIQVLTNGTLVSQARLEPFHRFRNVSFQVSLDGPDAASHDRVRGAGSFERARLGVKNLKQENFRVGLLATLSSANAHQIPAFFDTASAWAADAMGFTRLITTGFGENYVKAGEARPLEALEIRDAYRGIFRESARVGMSTSRSLPLMTLLHPGLGRTGRWGEGIVVDYRGNLLASSRSRLVLGSLQEHSLEKLFLKHPLLQKLRRGKIEGCGSCPQLQRCGGDRNAAYAATGNYLGRDPGCWLGLEEGRKEVG